MTIPKNAGLSHLADVANEQALTFHYPIKKKREPRRLRPNLDAIRYLEIEQEHATTIFETYQRGEEYIQRANGWFDAKRAQMYPRPMYDILPLGTGSAVETRYTRPCPACDDWSRTARCEEHHDRDGVAGLKLGAQRRAERGQVLAYASPDRAQTMADFFAQIIQAPRDPNEGRPGYHYHFPTDRWVPDTDDALGDFRAGAYRPESFFRPQVDLTRLDRVPDELGPTREHWLEAISRLQSGTITIDGTFEDIPVIPTRVEVNGETVQGIRSFTIHVEARDDDTARP